MHIYTVTNDAYLLPSWPAWLSLAVSKAAADEQGWSVYIHTGASVQKYNQDTFQPERWLEQRSADGRSSASAAREEAAASSSSSDAPTPAFSSAGQRSAACPEHSLPFGLGPRMCLGQQLVKTALTLLVAELASQYAWQMQDAREEWSVFPTVRPKQALLVHSFRKL